MGTTIGIDTSHKQWTHTEFTLEDFTYRNNIVESYTCLEILNMTNFTGITVSYNSVCKQQTMALFF